LHHLHRRYHAREDHRDLETFGRDWRRECQPRLGGTEVVEQIPGGQR
jgi:hypothetical protein